MIKVEFPDGRSKKYPKGITFYEIAKSISEGLARNVLAVEIGEEIFDLHTKLKNDCKIRLLTWDDNIGKKVFWHSSAHLMAEALESIYPGIKFAIGPPIENGFYYDIDFGDYTFSSDHFTKVEKKINELSRLKSKFLKTNVSKQEAKKYFSEKNDNYKLELIQELKDGEITFYQQGKFIDLCKGPHIPHTGHIKAFKILSTAGAYWRGNEKNKQLTRIYGISFPKNKFLSDYINFLEEAKKRDHRKIGKDLELFTFSNKVGQGLPLWLPNGTNLRNRLENFLKKIQLDNGYDPVITPHIGHKSLYVCSGHYDKYGSDSFQSIKTPDLNEEFFLKPMNCPHHCEIYKSKPRSYKDLPIRFAEFGTVYRYEQSGELHGLTRVRGFTQDDAHIFATKNQIQEEFEKVIDIVLLVFKSLGFEDFTAQVSLRDKVERNKYIGNDNNWKLAEDAIIKSAENKGLETILEYGEAAFYGPKLDFMVKDAIGRSWQLGTIQIDYNLPERFDLNYIGDDNKKHRPVMIHRAPFGSLERFIAVLTEHCNGNFPLWLSPNQVSIIIISEKFILYAKEVFNLLKISDIRACIDDRNEKTGRKIRDAEIKKTPYMLIIGEKESTENKISVRKHGGENMGSMKIEKFIEIINKEIKNSINK